MNTLLSYEDTVNRVLEDFGFSEGLDYSSYRDLSVVLFFINYLDSCVGRKYIKEEHETAGFDTPLSRQEQISKRSKIADQSLQGEYYLTDVLNSYVGSDRGKLQAVIRLDEKIREFFSNEDVLTNPGRYFESLIRFFMERSGKKSGALYTARTIVELMVGLVKPKSNEKIYDPVCGSGGFLVEALRYTKSHGDDYQGQLVGAENNLSLARISKINTFIHGEQAAVINIGDSLKTQFVADADVVLANPPFSVSGWIDDRRSLRFNYGLPPNSNADYAFIQIAIASLNEKGRAAILAPMGALFRGGAEGMIRKNLVLDNLLSSVMKLPSGLMSGTAIPVVIFVFEKSKKSKDVFFLDVGSAYEVEKHFGRETDYSAIALRYFDKKKSMNGISKLVGIDEIERNGFNLNFSRYISAEAEEKHTLVDLLARQRLQEEELVSLQKEFYELI